MVTRHACLPLHERGRRRVLRLRQEARELGIPAKFDHNWITKSLLDGLVEEGVLQKDENKLFTAA